MPGPSRLVYANVAEVYRLTSRHIKGNLSNQYLKINTIVDKKRGIPGELRCRIDTGYFRVGRDVPSAIMTPTAPMRSGLVVCDYTTGLRPGDRFKFIEGPIKGVFELTTPVDVAQSFKTASHIEFYVYECAKGQVLDIYPEAEWEE